MPEKYLKLTDQILNCLPFMLMTTASQGAKDVILKLATSIIPTIFVGGVVAYSTLQVHEHKFEALEKQMSIEIGHLEQVVRSSMSDRWTMTDEMNFQKYHKLEHEQEEKLLKQILAKIEEFHQ